MGTRFSRIVKNKRAAAGWDTAEPAVSWAQIFRLEWRHEENYFSLYDRQLTPRDASSFIYIEPICLPHYFISFYCWYDVREIREDVFSDKG